MNHHVHPGICMILGPPEEQPVLLPAKSSLQTLLFFLVGIYSIQVEMLSHMVTALQGTAKLFQRCCIKGSVKMFMFLHIIHCHQRLFP